MSSGRLSFRQQKFGTLIVQLLVRVSVQTEFRQMQSGLNLIQIEGGGSRINN